MAIKIFYKIGDRVQITDEYPFGDFDGFEGITGTVVDVDTTDQWPYLVDLDVEEGAEEVSGVFKGAELRLV